MRSTRSRHCSARRWRHYAVEVEPRIEAETLELVVPMRQRGNEVDLADASRLTAVAAPALRRRACVGHLLRPIDDQQRVPRSRAMYRPVAEEREQTFDDT